MKRREFLKLSCLMGAGFGLSSLGFNLAPSLAWAEEINGGKLKKVKAAIQSTSVCGYCSVACGLICSTDKTTGQIINIEGDPEHPVNEGSLCAKGAGTYQTTAANPHRLSKVLYRAPGGDKWEEKDWDWAIDRIARNIKKERDAAFMTKNTAGQTVNRVLSLAHMGSSTLENEECWTGMALMRSLGLVYIEHQARV